MKIQPNILITGTPGVGKSHLAKQVSEKLGLKWHNVSQIAKEHEFLEGFDKVLDCPILDEDAVSSWELCKWQPDKNLPEWLIFDFQSLNGR